MPVLFLALVGWSPAVARPEPSPSASAASDDLAALARIGTLGVDLADSLDPVALPGETADYAVDVPARSALTYLLPPGPKTVRVVTVEPAPGTAEAWRLARLRLTWETDDPAAAPGVDLPLGLLFGRVARSKALPAWNGLTDEGPGGRAWRARFPMPYRTAAIMRLDTEQPLKGRLRVRTTRGVDPGAGYFRAASWTAGAGATGAPARDEGRGHLLGYVIEGKSGPIRNPGRPDGFGWLDLDGKPYAPLALASGAPVRVGPEASPSAVFRWWADGPLSYERGFAVGGSGRAGGVRVAVFWYSERTGGSEGTPPAPKRVGR